MNERMRIPTTAAPVPEPDIEDWLAGQTEELESLFNELPRELWARHRKAIEELAANNAALAPGALDHAKVDYLREVVEKRESSKEEFSSRDPLFRESLFEHELGSMLDELLDSPEGMLGAGGTARVKRFSLPDKPDTAVKFLLTPAEDTLSAEGEHDMLWEVETITHIEEAEEKLGAGERIRVPHPYFYYKNSNVQCYGMQVVEGRTIEQLIDTDGPQAALSLEQRNRIWQALTQRYAAPEAQAALYTELDRFVSAMHEICLHDDMKPANVMVDEDGIIYLIDFGKSKRIHTITDMRPEQIANKQDDERVELRRCVRTLLSGIGRAKLAA